MLTVQCTQTYENEYEQWNIMQKGKMWMLNTNFVDV